MRYLVYGIAALAAVGIMIAIATLPADPDPASSTASATSAQTVSAEVKSEAGTLVMNVPKMHCEFACFPKVKDALEKEATVTEVALGEQSDEGQFNPQVVVKYDAGFDVNAAIKLLESTGYPDSEVVQ